MKLETKVIVQKKIPAKCYNYYGQEVEQIGPSHITVLSIEISLSDTCRLMIDIQRQFNFRKFGRTTERIIRELNKYVKYANFLKPTDNYTSWWSGVEKFTYVFYLGSADLERIKFSREQRKIVKMALDKNLKRYTRNPSKPKSDMEYRKRAYYGKCKK